MKWLAVCAVVAAPASACGNAPTPHEARPAAGGGWTVAVTLSVPPTGEMVLRAGRVNRAAPSDSRPWLQHTVAFTNTGARPITFADTRTSAFLGSHRRLIAADEGCGYGRSTPRATVEAGACASYLDIMTVPPGGVVERTVTLWHGLRGMAPLRAGTYVFRKVLRFAAGRAAPEPGQGRRVVMRLVYRVSRSPQARHERLG